MPCPYDINLPMSSPQKWVFLGKILREWGLRGQVRVISYNPDSELFAKLKEVYLEDPSEFRSIKIREVKRHGRFWVLHLAGYENPETAKQLRQIQLALPRDKMPVAKKGEFYLCDLEGLEVRDSAGEVVGTLKKFIPVGESEVMVIDRGGGREAMVPYRGEFVEKTSLEQGSVVLKKAAEELL